MRSFTSMKDFLQQVEFFVDVVAGYNADLLLLPELFNAPLMARYNQEDPPQAMRSLAKFHYTLTEPDASDGGFL